ncbi:MAG: GTPase ObgE [Pseudomonadota bacterium]
MTFVDEALITIRSGRGGQGCVSFLRERSRPFGGPDGGNGGRGGHVIATTHRRAETLQDYRYHPHQIAGNGKPGQGRARHGGAGKDRILHLPLGTEIIDAASQIQLADLTQLDQSEQILTGGRGGYGNLHFKSAGNRAPRRAEAGAPGQEMQIRLHLKLLADVGLVGLPNAGKSTLLSRLTRASPKIGDYPFTTTTPNLGALADDDGAQGRMRIADVPGLIAGAHTGRGLGHRFLRHIERCGLLLYVLSADDAPRQAWQTLNHEIRAYNPVLATKPALVVLTKIDLLAQVDTQVTDLRDVVGHADILPVSAHSGAGLEALRARLIAHINIPQETIVPPATKDAQDYPAP